MSTTRKRVVGAVAIAALAVPAPALAQTDPVEPTYGRIGGVTEGNVEEGAGPAGTAGARAAAPEQPPQGGNLPFTGFDAGLAAGAGLLLVLLGVGMRFLARHRTA